MKRTILLASLIFILIIVPFKAYSALTSTFDTGYDNWTTTYPVNCDYESSGGNPGGYISAVDNVGGMWDGWVFTSQGQWAGDLSSYVNGTLSFDIGLFTTEDSVNPYNYLGDVRTIMIFGSQGGELEWSANLQPSVGSWTTFSVQLIPSNFSLNNVNNETFESIMANSTNLYIRGDYLTGGSFYKTGLDNVKLTAAPVPLPHSILFLLSGLIGIWGYRKVHR
jgi:hypothetical protein